MMLTRSMRYRNVRADVLDILQKSLRAAAGEVVGLSWPRGRFLRQRCGRESSVCLDSLTPFRLSDSWRALAPLGSGERPGASGRGAGGGGESAPRCWRESRGGHKITTKLAMLAL